MLTGHSLFAVDFEEPKWDQYISMNFSTNYATFSIGELNSVSATTQKL